MLRPDDDRQLSLPFGGLVPSRCDEPAGESPAPVGTGAPGSRPQAGGETVQARAGCRKPLGREQPRGPQRYVNAAASSESQWESRAGHVAAKATPVEPDPERSADLPGVRAVARVEGSLRNRRDPSALPSSGQGAPYKPRVKSATAQRESEGIVVPMRPVQHNAGRGKGPCGGRVGSGGKREGMSGQRSGPTTQSGVGSTSKCDNSNADCGLLPSRLRSGESMPWLTASTGVTSCGRRGSVLDRITERASTGYRRPAPVRSPKGLLRRLYRLRGTIRSMEVA